MAKIITRYDRFCHTTDEIFEGKTTAMKNLEKFINSESGKSKIVRSDKMIQARSRFLSGGFDAFSLFLVVNNYSPYSICEEKIQFAKASDWFVDCYHKEIIDYCYKSYGNRNEPLSKYHHLVFWLAGDVMIDFSGEEVTAYFKNASRDYVSSIMDGIKKFRARNYTSPSIHILSYSQAGDIELLNLKVRRNKGNILDYYNDDFDEFHQTVIRELKKESCGLILLHGLPGTGKTNYLRFLIQKIKKKVIFIPPGLSAQLTGPIMNKLIVDNPSSILIIEDAEQVVQVRNGENSTAVSALLNLSDGLLSDSLNIKIICTFNVELSKVDPALLRPGRLIAIYEFRELEAEKANVLAGRLGFQTHFSQPLALAQLFNSARMEFGSQKKTIGFMK